jgi:heme/copper-type cytochrome/quinol oxidase subunit 2
MTLKRADLVYLVLVVFVLSALPTAVSAYNRYAFTRKVPRDAKVFLLTGNRDRGWIVGPVAAADVLKFSLEPARMEHPVLHVRKGQKVVLKLTSSDVVHGFSLKDFGVFVDQGIQPGKTTTVSFVANKVGTFKFVCNSICGTHHEKMYGTIVVTD